MHRRRRGKCAVIWEQSRATWQQSRTIANARINPVKRSIQTFTVLLAIYVLVNETKLIVQFVDKNREVGVK
jgi:hypothetical protein